MAHINTDFGGDEFHSVELKDMSQQQAAHELHSINAQSDPLQFRTFDHGVTEHMAAAPEDPFADSEQLMGQQAAPPSDSAAAGAPPANTSVWSLAHYQKYFDVTTKQVGSRLLRAVIVFGSTFYNSADSKPDLYGPFWIVTTLIFLMVAMGHLSSTWLGEPDLELEAWAQKMSVAASVLYCGITMLPLVVWFVLKKLGKGKGLAEVISIYGYSFTIFLPASVLCVVRIDAMQWIVVAVSYVISAQFLLRNLWSYFDISPDKRNLGYVTLAILLLFHAAIALLMKLYFFRY